MTNEPARERDVVEDLRLLEAWRTPGGPTPKEKMPNTYKTVGRAIAEITRLRELLEAKAPEIKTGANGQRAALLQINGQTVEVDIEIAPLVAALNAAGLATKASCSGHGFRPATIALADGRWIVLARDHAEFRRIEALFPLNINGAAESPAEGEMARATDAISNVRGHGGKLLGDILRGSEIRAAARAAIASLSASSIDGLVEALERAFLFICHNMTLGPTNDRTEAGKLIDSLRVPLAKVRDDFSSEETE